MSSRSVQPLRARERSRVVPSGSAERPVPAHGWPTGGAAKFTTLVVAIMVSAIALAAPARAQGGDGAIVTVTPLEPATSVWMRSSPHVGRRTCEVVGATPVRFIARASHGRHVYAEVEVLEGACAGQQGYVPWSYLEPEPPGDAASP